MFSQFKKSGLKNLLLLLFITCLANNATAQPGWRDLTQHCKYQILGCNNKPILFKTDSSYKIGIGDKIFSGSTIPADSFARAQPNTYRFFRQIKINDLACSVPLNGYNFDIRIMHGADTMHLSVYDDVSLSFDNGYFYFPAWTNNLLDDKLFEISENISIINKTQSVFKIPAALFSKYLKLADWQKHYYEADSFVVNSCIYKGLRYTVDNESTRFVNPMPVYKKPHWEGEVYATDDSNLFTGMTSYSLDTMNCYASKLVFSIFDKSKNSVRHWMPKTKPELFYEGKLFFDRYNKELYLNCGIRKKELPPCGNQLDKEHRWVKHIYQSLDFGNHWQAGIFMSKFFRKYNIEQLEFLDAHHQLTYTRVKIKINKPYLNTQGVYYLLENNKIIDSLKSPKDVYYDGNGSGYRFTRTKEDSIVLGPWYVNNENNYSIFKTPRLIKTNGQWRFSITKDSIKHGSNFQKAEITSTKNYRHFTLINNRELQFKNNSGRLKLRQDAVKILEMNDCICIVQYTCMLISFDAGKSWHFYPGSLNEQGNYSFIEMEGEGRIIFFDLINFKKYIYQFNPLP